MKHILWSLKVAVFSGAALLFTACSGDVMSIDSRTAVSAFVGENQDIIAFGSADLEEILSKANYTSVPKLGIILGGEMKQYREIIDMDVPVYYAVQGPVSGEGVPAATFAFLKVKDEEKFVSTLMQRGFDIDEDAEIKTGQDEGFAIGVRGMLAIVVAKEGDFDGKKLLEEAFKKTEGDPADGKVDEILDAKGDVVLGIRLSSLYNTSNTDLSKLSKDKQKELEEMVNESFVQTVVRFEDGAAVIESKNFFSPKLKERMFLKEDSQAQIVGKLGSGTPRMGFSMNVDMKKMQSFLDEFSPDAANELARSIGGPGQMALMAGGKDGLAGLLDGRLGLVLYTNGGDDEPAINFFVGLTKNGVGLANMAQGFMSGLGDSRFDITENSAAMYSNPQFAGPGRLNLPQGCENFGKSGFSAFISFEGVNFDEMDLDAGGNALRAIRYVTMDYNNDGGRIYIKAKEGKENVLEQMVNEVVSAMTDEISNLAI